MSLAIFGEELPQQRWGHTLVASSKKLLIFGGMHLKNYYDSSVYEVQIDHDNSQIHSFLRGKMNSPPTYFGKNNNNDKLSNLLRSRITNAQLH